MAITDYGVRGQLFNLLANYDKSMGLFQTALQVDSKLPAGSAENYGWLSTVASMEQWTGPRREQQPQSFKQLVQNVKYENGLSISLDLVKNDKTDQVNQLITEISKTYPLWMVQLLATQINNGTSGLSFDGQAFFSGAHSWGKTGSFSNVATPACVSASAITAFEAALGINMGIQLLKGMPDDQGRLIKNETMTRVVCVYQSNTPNAAAISTALSTMHGGMLGSGAGAVNNPLQGVDVAIDSVSSGLITTGQTIVTLFRHREDLGKGLILQENKDELLPSMITSPDSTYVVKNDAWFVGLKAVGNAAYGLPNDAIQLTFTA